MRPLIVACLILASGCCGGDVDASQPVVPTFQSVSISASERAQIMQEVNESRRAAKIRDAGMDPTRFTEFVGLIPANRRREFFLLLDRSPGLILQARPGSQDDAILKAAVLTTAERAAWATQRAGGQ